jgi:TIR domain
MADSGERDFFISYTQVNHPWAEWIAVQLEAAGYTTVLNGWDAGPAATSSMRCSRPPPRRTGGHRQVVGDRD